jgi:hypothetical protein
VTTLDLEAQARPESRALPELDARLVRQGPVELRPANEPEADEDLADRLTGLDLLAERLVDAGFVDGTLGNENRAE